MYISQGKPGFSSIYNFGKKTEARGHFQGSPSVALIAINNISTSVNASSALFSKFSPESCQQGNLISIACITISTWWFSLQINFCYMCGWVYWCIVCTICLLVIFIKVNKRGTVHRGQPQVFLRKVPINNSFFHFSASGNVKSLKLWQKQPTNSSGRKGTIWRNIYNRPGRRKIMSSF